MRTRRASSMAQMWMIWETTVPASRPLASGASAARCSKPDSRRPTSAKRRESLGLSNWDKPAAACLSSRVPRGITITRSTLSRVERAEAALAQEGFRQYRVRDHGEMARIELAVEELPGLLHPGRRERSGRNPEKLGYRFVTLDLEGYRQGGVSLTSPGVREANSGSGSVFARASRASSARRR